MFPLSAKQYVRSEPKDLVLSNEAVADGGAFTVAEKELRCCRRNERLFCQHLSCPFDLVPLVTIHQLAAAWPGEYEPIVF
jgi:hypothetical protein